MGISFVVREPGRPERRVSVELGATFGRHPSNTCVLADPTAGTWQARVAERGGELVLEDMGSRNGTRVVDGPVLRQGQCSRLASGARYLLGATVLEVGSQVSEGPGGVGGRARRGSAAPEADERGKSSSYLRTVVHGVVVQTDSDAPEAVVRFQGCLAAMKPRLVVADGVRARIVDVERPTTVVGRKDADVRIEHLSVSSPHARILFDGKLGRFFVEDAGSSNGSFLAEEVLLPGGKRELLPEAHLRFGDVHALWVADALPDGGPIGAERRERALALLVRGGELSSAQRKSALADAIVQGRHGGEILVMRGVVSAAQWVKAFRRAGDARDTIEIEKKWLVAACILLAVAIVVLLAR